MDNGKIKLFLDIDDTTLRSSEAVVKILNKRYGTNQDVKNLKDWSYRSLFHDVTIGEIERVYESDEFFEIVEWDKAFIDFYQNNKDDFELHFISAGSKTNLDKKEAMIKEMFPGAKLVRCPVYDADGSCIKKSIFNMHGAIQVDDRTDNLVDTNAKIKILVKNHRDVVYNRVSDPVDNLYITQDFAEVAQILQYAKIDPVFLK